MGDSVDLNEGVLIVIPLTVMKFITVLMLSHRRAEHFAVLKILQSIAPTFIVDANK